MTPTLLPAIDLNPCHLPLVGRACSVVGGVAKAAAEGIWTTIAKGVIDGAASIVKNLLTLFVQVGTPQVDQGIIDKLNSDVRPLAGLLAVACVAITAARMAMDYRGGNRSTHQLLRGTLFLVMAGAAVPIVNQASSYLDDWSTWVISQSTSGGSFDSRVGGFTAAFTAMQPVVATIIGLILIIAAFANLAIMIIRLGVVAILLGAVVPVTAASAYTETGEAALRKVVGWVAAWVLLKPTVALIIAGGFTLVGDGTHPTDVIAGAGLLALSCIALVPLLKIINPLIANVGHTAADAGNVIEGGAAGAMLVATGARAIGDSPAPAPASSSGPTGATGATGATGGNGGPGPAGSNGSSGGNGAAATNGGAASNGTGAAAGPVGVGVMVGTQVASGAKSTAERSAGEGIADDQRN